MELRYLWKYGDWRYIKIINKLNEKRSLIPWRLRVPIWRINFCSRVLLRLSELPRCRGKAANCYMLFIMTREIKCLATGLDVSLPFSFYVGKVFCLK